MELKYNYAIKHSTMPVKCSYQEKIPENIIDVLKVAMSQGYHSAKEYINAKITPESDLNKIATQMFNSYEYLLTYSLSGSEIDYIIETKHVQRYDELKLKVLSFQPLCQHIVCTWKSNVIRVNGESVNENDILKFLEKTKVNCRNFKIDDINNNLSLLEYETDEEELKLNFDGTEFKYMNYSLAINEIDFYELLEENKLATEIDLENSYVDDFNKYSPLTDDIFQNYVSNNMIHIGQDDTTLDYVKIDNETAIHRKIINVLIIPMYIDEEYNKEKFKSDSDLYKCYANKVREVLKDKTEKIPTMNKMILLELLRNEKDIAEDIMKDDKIKKFCSDTHVIKSLLLNENIMKIPFDINKASITQILIEASNVQLPKMMAKISKSTKNTLSNTRLLRKIENVDRTLLNEDQLKVIDDENLKLQSMLDEHKQLKGEITSCAVRELIKKLTNKDFEKLKINKMHIKKWLDEEIGHLKTPETVETITEQKVSSARRIYNESMQIVKYMKSSAFLSKEKTSVLNNENKSANKNNKKNKFKKKKK